MLLDFLMNKCRGVCQKSEFTVFIQTPKELYIYSRVPICGFIRLRRSRTFLLV
ncbi:hypothetical protein EZS27_035522, partial [termite gut metagenome]